MVLALVFTCRALNHYWFTRSSYLFFFARSVTISNNKVSFLQILN